MKRLIAAAALFATQAACATMPIASPNSATEQERLGADRYAVGRVQGWVGWTMIVLGALGVANAATADDTLTVDRVGRVGYDDGPKIKAGVAAGVVAGVGVILAAVSRSNLDEGSEHFARALELRNGRDALFRVKSAEERLEETAPEVTDEPIAPAKTSTTSATPAPKRPNRAPFYSNGG